MRLRNLFCSLSILYSVNIFCLNISGMADSSDTEGIISMKHKHGLPMLSDIHRLTTVDSSTAFITTMEHCYTLEAIRNCSTHCSASDAKAFLKFLQSLNFWSLP